MGFSRNLGRGQTAIAPLLNDLGLPATLLSPLLAHASDVASNAERLGLVSPGDIENVVGRHTADSLLFAIARRPLPGERWADIGSGAGFPGLVLAICYPGTAFTLVEPLRKRAGFLELQAASLGLANVLVEAARAEGGLRSRFDVAAARALAGPGETLARLIELVKPGGAAMVAAGPSAPIPAGARVVRVENSASVDSPGVLFMMSREV